MPKDRTRDLIGLLAVIGAVLPSAATGQDLALTNARVVDPVSRTVTEGTLLVQEGRVTALGSDVAVPAGVETRDVEGRWVMPALFDLHTHSFGNSAPGGAVQMTGPGGTANLALYAGVKGYLDLFSPEDMILGMRDMQRSSGGTGADIYASGPCLTATGGHCSEYGVPTRLVDSPEDVRREIAQLAPKKPDVVKVVYDNNVYGGRSMPTVDRATLAAVVDGAHAHGFKVVVHVGTWQDVRDAAEVGADAVTHTPGPDPVPSGLAELMVDRGTLHIPTLAVQSELARIVEDPAVLDRALLQDVVARNVIEDYQDPDAWPPRMQGFLTWVRSLRQANLEAVGELAAAGVPMATGTDAGNPGVFQGYSVHRELEFLVEAGLSEWDALAAATTTPAAFLGDDWGVHEGAEATFIVLDGSPLESILNTQQIHGVVQRGVWVDRAALRE